MLEKKNCKENIFVEKKVVRKKNCRKKKWKKMYEKNKKVLWKNKVLWKILNWSINCSRWKFSGWEPYGIHRLLMICSIRSGFRFLSPFNQLVLDYQWLVFLNKFRQLQSIQKYGGKVYLTNIWPVQTWADIVSARNLNQIFRYAQCLGAERHLDISGNSTEIFL